MQLDPASLVNFLHNLEFMLLNRISLDSDCTYYCDKCSGPGYNECLTCSDDLGILDNGDKTCECNESEDLYFEDDAHNCISIF